DVLRDLLLGDDRAVLVADLGHRLAARVGDGRRLRQRDLVGQLDAVEVVADADHADAAEHDEHRHRGQDDVAAAGPLAAPAALAADAETPRVGGPYGS